MAPVPQSHIPRPPTASTPPGPATPPARSAGASEHPGGLSRLSVQALDQRLRELAARGARLLAVTLDHLAELDVRKAYLPLGYASLFEYCCRGLNYSEGQAYRRIQAARVWRRFAAVREAVGSGRLHLTALGILAPVLTSANVADLVREAAGLSKRALQARIEALQPAPLSPPSRPLGAPANALLPFGSAPAGSPAAPESQAATSGPGPQPPPAQVAPAQPTLAQPTPAQVAASLLRAGVAAGGTPALGQPTPAQAQPVPRGHRTASIRVSAALLAKLERARALLGHTQAQDDTTVLEMALDRLIAQVETRRFGAALKRKKAHEPPPASTPARSVALAPASSAGDPSSGPAGPSTAAPAPPAVRPPTEKVTEKATGEVPQRAGFLDPPARPTRPNRPTIPAAVRRAVYERDEGCCAFVGAGGHRCGTRRNLELHHLHPFARGGADTEANLALRCAAHNKYEARRAGLHSTSPVGQRLPQKDPGDTHP